MAAESLVPVPLGVIAGLPPHTHALTFITATGSLCFIQFTDPMYPKTEFFKTRPESLCPGGSDRILKFFLQQSRAKGTRLESSKTLGSVLVLSTWIFLAQGDPRNELKIHPETI
jgi:hypothetical protein